MLTDLLLSMPPAVFVGMCSLTPLALVWCGFKGIRLWLAHRKRVRGS